MGNRLLNGLVMFPTVQVGRLWIRSSTSVCLRVWICIMKFSSYNCFSRATTAAEWLVTILLTARPHIFHSKAVVLATGGCGKIFKITSNGFASTGDGFALALDSLVPLRGYGVCSVSPYRHLRAWHPY